MSDSPFIRVSDRANHSYVWVKVETDSPSYDKSDTLGPVFIPTPGRMSISMGTLFHVDGERVRDLPDAERKLLSRVEVTHEYDGSNLVDQAWAPAMTLLPSAIQRTSSLIATQGRRGSGNIVLMGCKVLMQLRSNTPTAMVEDFTGQKCGQWDYVGVLHNSMKVYVGPDIPPSEVVVCYVGLSTGSLDGFGALLSDGNGGQYLTTIPEDKLSHVGGINAYMKRMRFHFDR